MPYFCHGRLIKPYENFDATWVALSRCSFYDRRQISVADVLNGERVLMSIRLVLASALMLFVAACNRNPLEVTISRCLAVAVVGDVGTLTQFQGSGRTTEDVVFTASIRDVQSSCDEGDSVESEVVFTIGAQGGPALADSEVTIPYFAAVLKDNSQIITKRVYDVTLRFDSEGKAVSREVLTQFVPTIEQARRYNYELLIGFQLDPKDAVFNIVR